MPFLLFGIQTESIIYGVMAVIGHCFPIFYKFKGGKGVATYLGSVVGYIIFQESTVLITASQILIVVLIFYQHRENLSRLSKGDENKF